MLKFLKGKKKCNSEEQLPPEAVVTDPAQPEESDTDAGQEFIPLENQVATEPEQPQKKKGLFSRLKNRLSKTRSGLTDGLSNLFLGKKQLDDDLLEEIETRLLMADVGIEATQEITKELVEKLGRKELNDASLVVNTLRDSLFNILEPCSKPLEISEKKPFVILVVGVNGVGKTTTIGKLAKRFHSQGLSVMLAAGDTFRAAAVEQLQVWGERNNIHVVAQHTGADSASVVYDAVASAKAKEVDVVIADTAGRLHTKSNLMEELKKINRVIGKLDDTAPHEVLLVVDASTGQNALSQATSFNETVKLSGICLTKLDGTAKGGIIFAIANKLRIPIRFIGVGEGIDDLRVFDGKEFVAALFDDEEPEQ
ncbi:MAG: signal recognition particle-docking protein FtsY [Gammaproteobacteria bacterium]|nr:MAG: signal recognition particle-docking protein FtsY [Gammaproteobacteria bacterium]